MGEGGICVDRRLGVIVGGRLRVGEEECEVVGKGIVFFFKQKTAYEIYQCDWSSDVCSSDLIPRSLRRIFNENFYSIPRQLAAGQFILL